MKRDYAKIREPIDIVEEKIDERYFVPRRFKVANCKTLNVRQRPNRNAKVIAQIKVGDHVVEALSEFKDEFDEFVCISTGDILKKEHKGYCVKDYLEEVI